MRRICLAYSGGLDTSVILRWLKDRYAAEIVAFCADLGQEGGARRACREGARDRRLDCVIDDLREEFVRDFVFPMLRAGAIYETNYLLGTSIARPLIAKRQVEVARASGADAVAHGATGKGNDQVRFELTLRRARARAHGDRALARSAWTFQGRADLIAYAEQQKIPVTATVEKPYSTDRNLLHVSYEAGILEDPWRAPYDDMFQLTTAPEKAPDQAEDVEVDVEAGTPVAVNGERLAPAALLDAASTTSAGRARHRPRRHRREPLRRHEVARRLRDAGRHRAARRDPDAVESAHARPRGDAPPRHRSCRATPR